MGITEHIEGDECKFAVWTAVWTEHGPTSENKIILKVGAIFVWCRFSYTGVMKLLCGHLKKPKE